MTQKKKRTHSKPSRGQVDSAESLRHPEGAFDVVVIGGGASGLACAIACAQSAKHSRVSLRIAVLEAGRRIGASIMRSGNGRCNFSHAAIDEARYHNAPFVREAYRALEQNPAVPSVVEWFESLGLVWEEAPGSGGLLYPFSNKANSVLDVLRCALEDHHIEAFERTQVHAVSRAADRSRTYAASAGAHAASTASDYAGTHAASAMADRSWTHAASAATDRSRTHAAPVAADHAQEHAAPSGLDSHQACVTQKDFDGASNHPSFVVEYETTVGEGARRKSHNESPETLSGSIAAHAVVVATGGMSGIACERILSSFGLARQPEAALLGPLNARSSQGISFTALDGIRVQAAVSVPVRRFFEKGEVLFRKYGISGIVVFNASRYAHEGDELLLDLVPNSSQEQLEELLCRRVDLQRQAESFLTGFVVEALAQAILKIAAIDPQKIVTTVDAKKIARALKHFPLIVGGIADERACQVKRGGIRVDEVDPATLQVEPGLYVLGEALDVDGPCGGYNLHWAWVTGLLAGSDIGSRAMA